MPWLQPALYAKVSDYDGIAQLWFDYIESFHGIFSSKNYTDAIRVDEQKFIDPNRVEFLFSEETAIIS